MESSSSEPSLMLVKSWRLSWCFFWPDASSWGYEHAATLLRLSLTHLRSITLSVGYRFLKPSSQLPRVVRVLRCPLLCQLSPVRELTPGKSCAPGLLPDPLHLVPRGKPERSSRLASLFRIWDESDRSRGTRFPCDTRSSIEVHTRKVVAVGKDVSCSRSFVRLELRSWIGLRGRKI